MRPNHHDTLPAEVGTCTCVPDGESGRSYNRTSPLCPRPEHDHGQEKFLRDQVDWYAMVASSAGAPSFTDVEILSAPDGVTLPQNFSMARG